MKEKKRIDYDKIPGQYMDAAINENVQINMQEMNNKIEQRDAQVQTDIEKMRKKFLEDVLNKGLYENLVKYKAK